ncbi:unnamed protein product [Chrysodeixis includens]|uniref:Uncharacterized protein n=1 Tax=Chrysodeixis includens TaxID=689277 RepID=A0A9N8KWW5_CHRIL|nr:unnamed protein product [Chrysodeixis includens]
MSWDNFYTRPSDPKLSRACVMLVGLLTLAYLVYQYWGLLFKGQEVEEDEECRHSPRLSRSRSRSVFLYLTSSCPRHCDVSAELHRPWSCTMSGHVQDHIRDPATIKIRNMAGEDEKHIGDAQTAAFVTTSSNV